MSFEPPGSSASKVEVTNISAHGIWLLTGEDEHFLSYKDFPYPGHFYWPELDVELGLVTIRHPDRFPLRADRKT